MGSGAKWIDETNRPVNDLDPHEDRETAFDLGHESAFNTRGGPRPAFTRGLHARYASCWQSAAVGDQVNEYDGKIGKKKGKRKKGKKEGRKKEEIGKIWLDEVRIAGWGKATTHQRAINLPSRPDERESWRAKEDRYVFFEARPSFRAVIIENWRESRWYGMEDRYVVDIVSNG